MVDLQSRRLVDNTTNLKSNGAVEQVSVIDYTWSARKGSDYDDLIQQYQEITRPNNDAIKLKSKAGIFHYIETTGRPVTEKARCLLPGKYHQATALDDTMQQVIKFITNGWPPQFTITSRDLQKLFDYKDELQITHDVLSFRDRKKSALRIWIRKEQAHITRKR